MKLSYLDPKKMVGGWKRCWKTTQEEEAKDQLTLAGVNASTDKSIWCYESIASLHISRVYVKR